MKKVFQIIRNAVRRATHVWTHRNRLRQISVDELPDVLRNRRLYLIGHASPWSAALLCPCGCGEVINLSLLADDSPSWKISAGRDGLPSLSPSVWRTQGCRSHFFLQEGKVLWCDSHPRKKIRASAG